MSDSSTPWTVAHQAPLCMGFSRQEHWSGLPFPTPGDLPNPGIELKSITSLHWQVGSLPLVPPGKPSIIIIIYFFFSEKGACLLPPTILMRIKEWLGERECDTFTLGSEHFWVEVANHAAYRILIPQSGIEPTAMTVKALSLNHWTSREVLGMKLFQGRFPGLEKQERDK